MATGDRYVMLTREERAFILARLPELSDPRLSRDDFRLGDSITRKLNVVVPKKLPPAILPKDRYE